MNKCEYLLEKYFGVDEKLHRKAYAIVKASDIARQDPSDVNLQSDVEDARDSFRKAWVKSRERYYLNGRNHVSTSVKYYDLKDSEGNLRYPEKEDVKRERQKGSRKNRGF